MPWQGGFKNPYRGIIVWPEPDLVKTKLTLFKVKNKPNVKLKERNLNLNFHVSLMLGYDLQKRFKLVQRES